MSENLKKDKIFFKIMNIKQKITELNYQLTTNGYEDIENINLIKKYIKDKNISYSVVSFILFNLINNIDKIDINEYNTRGKNIIDEYVESKKIENKIKKINKNKISQHEKSILKKTSKLGNKNNFFGDI